MQEPSLRPSQNDFESVTIELPEYDERRLITSRDPLCCLYAFKVMTKVVLPSLYGFRMCPDCPHCAHGDNPCMDYFGSNATCMGGGAGRADALIAGQEAQKAEGAFLHIHSFIYFQSAHQLSLIHI